MAVFKMKTQNSSTTQYEALPADTYLMRIRDARITQSSFKDDRTGDPNLQMEITWEVVRLTPEQEEAGADPNRWVKQWLGFYYGQTKNGPSKFKALLDDLRAQGHLEEFDESSGEFDPDWLVGIEQRVLLTVSGSWNRVVGVSAPLKSKKGGKAEPKRNAPQPIDEREEAILGLRQLYKKAKVAGVEDLPTKEQIDNSDVAQLKAIAASLEEMIAAKEDPDLF